MPKVNVDYDGMAFNPKILTINVFFQSSDQFDYIWLFRSKKTGQISQLDLNKTKYESKCVQLNIFDFKCFLFIDYFSEEDVGQYYFKSNLKENPKISFEINTWAVLPSESTHF